MLMTMYQLIEENHTTPKAATCTIEECWWNLSLLSISIPRSLAVSLGDIIDPSLQSP